MSGFTGHLPGSRDYRRLLAGLFFAGLATFAQLYSPQAVLPLISVDLDVSPATAALVVSASTLGVAVSVLPWSLVADRIGRVPAMGIGIVAATILGISAPFSTEIATLLSVRLLEGMALGAVPAIALAYLSEEVDAGHAAAAVGSYVSGTTVGGLAGRVVAGPVADLAQWRVGVWVVAVLCAVAAVLFLTLAPRAQGSVRRPWGSGPGIVERMRGNLRSRRQWALYAQAALLMGGFVAVYNYLGFHVLGAPFLLPGWVVSFLFTAYLAGTVSSPWAGRFAVRFGRLRVLVASIGVATAGLALMLVTATPAVIAGLLVFTAGFFAAHTVASGWAPVSAPPGARAQASALYNLAFYVGSSVFGWLLGLVFAGVGWSGMVTGVMAMCALAAAVAVTGLRRPASGAGPR